MEEVVNLKKQQQCVNSVVTGERTVTESVYCIHCKTEFSGEYNVRNCSVPMFCFTCQAVTNNGLKAVCCKLAPRSNPTLTNYFIRSVYKTKVSTINILFIHHPLYSYTYLLE